MPEATLVIREGAESGSEFPLDGELVIGRERSADLVLDDPGISRKHAAVRSGAGITVEDLGSSNGTYVNGSRISGEVGLADGDEIRLGGTVISVHGAEVGTATMPPPAQPAPARGPLPGRLGPDPHAESNIPALCALFLGPLSIFLLVFSTGASFFVSLPVAIAAIVLGTIGIRKVDRGEADSHRGLARAGRLMGIAGAVLSTLALVAFIVVSVALDVTEDSLDGVADAIQKELDDVPDVPDIPDVPSVPDTPDLPDQGGQGNGGTQSP